MIEDLNQLARMLNGYIRDLLEKTAKDLIVDGSRDSKNVRRLDPRNDVYAKTEEDWPGAVFLNVLGQQTSVSSRNGYWCVGSWPVARATETGLARMQRCIAEFVEAACAVQRGQPLTWFDHQYRLRRPDER